MSSKKQVIVMGAMAKTEASYAAGATVAGATDGVLLAQEAKMAYNFEFPGDREPAIASGAPFRRVAPKARTVKVPLVIEPRGAGGAYGAAVVPFDTHVLLQIAGHSATLVNGVSWTYAPISAAWTSGYLEAYSRGQKWPVVGCYSDFGFTIEKSGIPHFMFDVQGRLDTSPTDVAVPAITYNSTVFPPEGEGLAVVIGNYTSAKVRKIEFKKNQVIAPRIDISSAAPVQGHAGFGMGRRNAEITIELEAETLTAASPWTAAGTLNPYELLAGGYQTAPAQPVSVSVSFTVGVTAFNKWVFTAPQCYLIDVQESEDGPAAIWTLKFQCVSSTPVLDDDYSILFN